MLDKFDYSEVVIPDGAKMARVYLEPSRYIAGYVLGDNFMGFDDVCNGISEMELICEPVEFEPWALADIESKAELRLIHAGADGIFPENDFEKQLNPEEDVDPRLRPGRRVTGETGWE